MGAGAFAGGSALWPMLGMLGSSALGGLMAPDGQELQTFEGEGELDPKQALGESRSQLNDMISLLKARADRPVNLRSSYAQNLPVFTGGGLPMPIGVYGTDPALRDPSLLSSTPAMGLSGANTQGVVDRSFAPRGTDESGGGIIPDPTNPNAPPRSGEPTSGPYGQPLRRSAARGQSLFAPPGAGGGAAAGGGGDDLAQGTGAVELFLRSLGG